MAVGCGDVLVLIVGDLVGRQDAVVVVDLDMACRVMMDVLVS
jgi:hypothetical protein